MKNKNGESIYFESDAYHLKSWCEENNLKIHTNNTQTTWEAFLFNLNLNKI